MSNVLRLVDAPLPSFGDKVLSPGDEKFTVSVRKSEIGGWNATVTKKTSTGVRTMFCSSDRHDEILSWAIDKLKR